MEVEALSESFWFTVIAYVSAILPWTVISSTDFIKSSWRSVRDTRKAGYRDLFWTFLPMGYVIFYSFVQGKVGEYSEMCASAVAALLAALLGLRTIWGLWQLREFRLWAKRSIDALDAVGIEYCLPGMEEKLPAGRFEGADRRRSADIADEILVNEKIVENLIMHGDVHCYLKFGNIELLTKKDGDLTLLGPLFSGGRWILFTGAVMFEFLMRIIRSTKASRTRVKQVPFKPVDVWIHWAAAFASQGLQRWMSEFEVALEPWRREEKNRSKSGMERFQERGDYFAAEVLASATMHLWGEYGKEKGVSPFLWKGWDDLSEMSDGRVVKQELLREAIEKGICLPFGARQSRNLVEWTDVDGELRVGYDAYQESLREFISELPVQSSFVQEMRKFDVNMLEWLTIVLHIGHMAQALVRESASGNGRAEGEEKVQNSHVSREWSRSSRDGIDEESAEGVERGDEAVRNLCAQLNMKETSLRMALKRDKSVREYDQSGARVNLVSGIPIMRDLIAVTSDGNRLVTKVGELIDIWLSLVIGDQITFLVDKLNDEWESMCLGEELHSCLDEENVGGPKDLIETHKELERRRLERRIADRDHRYGYLDQFVSFMGYRMEIVRTIIGRWVKKNNGKVGNDLFEISTQDVCEDESIEVELSGSMLCCLRQIGAVRRRGVQCRLIWELQNYLEKTLLSEKNWNEKELGGRTNGMIAMLFILSFPGLKISLRSEEHIPAIEQEMDYCCIDLECCKGNVEMNREEDHVHRQGNEQGGQEHEERRTIEIYAMCGPQRMRIIADVGRSKWCSLRLKSCDGAAFKWEWWRDAFEGRLQGFQEWQTLLGVSASELDTGRIEAHGSVIVEMSGITEAKTVTWREWTPFRTEFCRFELEVDGFLREPQVDGYKEAVVSNEKLNSTYQAGVIPIQKVKKVSYKNANESALKHSCFMVQEMLKDRQGAGEISLEECRSSNAKKVDLILEACKRLDNAHALVLYRIAALHYGNSEGMRRSVEMLCGKGDGEGSVLEAIGVLQSFLGTLLSPNHRFVTLKSGDLDKVENVVLPACELLLLELRGNESDVKALSEVLGSCLATNPERYERKVMMMLQRLTFVSCGITPKLISLSAIQMGTSVVEVTKATRSSPSSMTEEVPFYQAKALTVENNRMGRRILMSMVELGSRLDTKTVADGQNSNTLVEGGRFKTKMSDSIRDRSPSIREYDRTTINKYIGKALNRLGGLLMLGTEGIQADPSQAIDYYQEAIARWGNVWALNNLGLLFERGAEGVERDPRKAAELFERATHLGDTTGMSHLGGLLKNGADGVPADAKRAIKLFERAILEGREINAMYNLAVLLENGADGVPADGKRAAELYEQAVHDGGHIVSMVNLGVILEHDGEHGAANPRRSAELYERAIKEGNSTTAMFNLGILLESGVCGVPANPKRAVELFERATKEGGDVDAMNRLANLLKNGAEGVPADARKALHLYERAIEGGNVLAIGNLGLLLSQGAEGVQVDVNRAVQLYERAIEEGEPNAMCGLAILLERGTGGVPTDIKRAAELYRRSIEEGNNVTAMVKLGSLLWNGTPDVPADATKSAELLEQAIQNGNLLAMQLLALFLQDGGVGMPADPKRAADLLERAVEKGYVDSMVSLGFLLQNGADGVDINLKRAVTLYERAIAEEGNVIAMTQLGLLMENGGEGIPADKARAVALYKRAIDEHAHIPCMFKLGIWLLFGADGVPADRVQARKLLERVIAEECNFRTIASYWLGLLLIEGAGEEVAADPKRAVELFQNAAEDGHIDAMFRLGLVLKNGAEGTPVNLSGAVELFEQILEKKNHAGAMGELGLLLSANVNGVEKNRNRAVELLERAVEAGNQAVMLRLAWLLITGARGEADDGARGIALFERMTEDGNIAAMKSLACIFLSGMDGVEADADRAVKLLQRAVDADKNVDNMLYLATGMFKAEKDLDAYKKLVREAIASGERVEEAVGLLHQCWKALRDGGAQIDPDVELAEEIEAYAATFGIALDTLPSWATAETPEDKFWVASWQLGT